MAPYTDDEPQGTDLEQELLDPDSTRRKLKPNDPAPVSPTPGTNSSPVTSDADPRLSDPTYATDPDVLGYINNGRGRNTVNGPMPVTNTAPAKATKSPDYILNLIRSGMSPQDAAAAYNREFNTTEAVYYDPSQHGGHATIGLPDSYLTDEGNWGGAVQRMPEGPTSAAAGGGAASASGGGGDSALSQFLMDWLGKRSPASGNRDALFSRLMGLADQYGKPVTADDPNIKAASDAYHGASARSLADFRTMAAERAHAQGVGTGAFDSQLGNAEMATGRSEAGFTTGMMNTELQSRRQALMSVLQQAGTQLSAEDQSDIQSKVAAIDGLLRGRGLDLTDKSLGIQDKLGSLSLELQRLLGVGSLDNQRIQTGNQNNQFYDKLGTDNAFNQAQLDYLMRSLGLK